MRKIELDVSQEFRDSLPHKDVNHAIGRLALWSIDRFDTVKIYEDGKTDLVANYSSTTSPSKYTIGAVWRGTEFSFHS